MQEPQTEPGGVPSPREALGQCRRCVAGMLDRLEEFAGDLFAHVRSPAAEHAERARILVAEIDEALNLHMADEETDVFPAVLASADSPARRAQAFELVSSLLVEHREVAEQWLALRITLLAVGGGVPAAFPGGITAGFLARARAHLDREECELAELMGMVGSSQSRQIAASIAQRHDEVCCRIANCPRRP